MGNLVRKRQHKDLILSLITPIIWILPLPAALVHQSGLRACLERDRGHPAAESLHAVQAQRTLRKTRRYIMSASASCLSSPLRNQSRADLLPADRVLEGARHGKVERSWESGVVGQPLGGGAGAAPLFLRPLQ